MKLLIIRHGDPDYSIDSLTETGWKEAALVAERICKLNVAAFYCSPFGRAKDTASLTLKAMGREAEILTWMREFLPPVEKPTKEFGLCAWDWLPQDWMNRPAFYDKDHWCDEPEFVAARTPEETKWVTDGLDAVLAKHGYVRDGAYYRAEKPNTDTIVFFCHFGVQCVMLGHLLGISPMCLWHGLCAAPSSVTTIVTEERRKGIASFRVGSFGDISHLYAAGREPSFSARFCEVYSDLSQRHD